jgi:hypothetical protein
VGMPEFNEISFECSGMLAPAIYQRLYELARDRPEGDIVEVGTSRGAATVALALGLKASGKPGRVLTCGRPTQNRHGGPVSDNFRRFGVDDVIDYHQCEAQDLPAIAAHTGPIGLLLLDADGCIDRDLLAFFDRIVVGAPVIIDDCEDKVRLNITPGVYRVDSKMRLSRLLLDAFRRSRALSEGDFMKCTYFGVKGSQPPPSQADVIQAYRGLVFTKAHKVIRSQIRSSIVSFLDTVAPRLTNRIRGRYRNGRAGVSAA